MISDINIRKINIEVIKYDSNQRLFFNEERKNNSV